MIKLNKPEKKTKSKLEKFNAVVLSQAEEVAGMTYGADRSSYTKIENVDLLFLYETHAIIYAIVNKIAKRIAGQGYQFLDKDGESIEDANTARIEEIFKSSQNNTSLLLQIRKWVQDIIVTGDCYAEKVVFNPRVIKIDPVSPKYMKKKVSANGDLIEYIQSINGEVVARFAPDEMYSEGLNNGDIYGISPVRAIWREIQADLMAIVFNNKFFENSANPTTMLFLKDEVNSMDKDAVENIKKQLMSAYRGAVNNGKPLINNVIADVKTIDRDLDKMQFLETRDKFIEKACSAFDISKVMLGITDSANEATASKSMRQEFYLTAVKPYEQIVERFINDEILPDLGYGDYKLYIVEQDFSDINTKIDSIIKQRDAGLISTNQARVALGEPLIEEPWADELLTKTSTGYVMVKPQDNIEVPPVSKSLYTRLTRMFNDNQEQEE